MKGVGRRIQDDLSRLILSGEWAPGRRTPTEAELMAEYGCSRMTASRAMSDLAARGLVTRRRRAGTVVAHPPVHSTSVLDIADIQAEIEARGMRWAHRLLDRQERSASPDERWLGDAGVLAVTVLHLADDDPFALERRLIGLKAAPDARDVDFAVHAPGRWLLDHSPWTDGEHRIAAVAADRDATEALDLAPGEACLRIERRTWADDLGVTWAWQTFPGQAYDLVARFAPARQDPR